MATKYYAVLTNVGAAKLANATALGAQVEITQMAVGDGNGVLPTLNPAQTALVHELRRKPLNSLSIDPNNANQIIAEQVIPEDEGGWWIREIGLFDKDGDMIAVANCAETYKPQLQEGSGRVQVVRMILIVSSTAAVTLKIDPSVVLATRQYVDDQIIQVKSYVDQKMAAHVAAADPHKQYAPKESPALTGRPTAPTAEGKDSSTQIANTAFVQAAIAALVGSSPEALDTLNELAAALGNDPNFATTVTNSLAGKMDKSANGSDIENVSVFLQNLGLSESDEGGVSDKVITTKLPYPGAVVRTQHDKNADFVSVLDFGAVGDGVSDDSVAVHAALATGKNVYFPGAMTGRYYAISRLIYPYHDGQVIYGDGQDNTFIINNFNDEPLFCFGNPSSPTGYKQWCLVKDLTFSGNQNGGTLWGVFSPNAPLVNGEENISGQYEGISTSANNFYYGKTSFVLTDWESVARGNGLYNVAIMYVKGGYALHVSAWAFKADKVRLWSGKQGLRNSGSANGNHFSGLYISSMTCEGIIEPNVDSTIPTACQYDSCIVQRCGVGELAGKASIELYKGQGTAFRNLYLEKNNERGGATDIFIGVAAVGTVIDTVRHRVDTGAPLPVIIENQGQGTRAEGITYGSDVASVIVNSGTDTRTSLVVGVIMSAGGTASSGEISDTSTGNKVLYRDIAGRVVSLGSYTDVSSSNTRGLKIRQGSSTARLLELVSAGFMQFIVDSGNIGSGRTFTFAHNGENGTETSLVEISDRAGLYPGTANSGSIGTAARPWGGGYTQTALTVTSDERYKGEPEAITDAMMDAWSEVDYIQFQYSDRVETKGSDAARWHTGIIAQRAKEAFERHGLNPFRYAFFCYDAEQVIPAVYDEIPEVLDEAGEIITPSQTVLVRESETVPERYGIRYEQALALESALNRRERKKLEERITALESR
ncbi:phage tail protein [Escherichia coli]